MVYEGGFVFILLQPYMDTRQIACKNPDYLVDQKRSDKYKLFALLQNNVGK